MQPDSKPLLHAQNIENARAYLETRMELADLPEESREKLRGIFRGRPHRQGMREAVNVEKRSNG